MFACEQRFFPLFVVDHTGASPFYALANKESSFEMMPQLISSATLASFKLPGTTFVTRPRHDTNMLLSSIEDRGYVPTICHECCPCVCFVAFSLFSKRTRDHHETNFDFAYSNEHLPAMRDADGGWCPWSGCPQQIHASSPIREQRLGFPGLKSRHFVCRPAVTTETCNLVRSPTAHVNIHKT